MSKISDLNYSQHITLADNFKQKSEVLNTWRVGMNNFARNAEGQDNTRNILNPKTFLEFLVKIFTLGYVDFSKRSNEAGRNMMAHIESSSYIKNNDGSEIMKFVMNNPEGERADSPKVIIEISLFTQPCPVVNFRRYDVCLRRSVCLVQLRKAIHDVYFRFFGNGDDLYYDVSGARDGAGGNDSNLLIVFYVQIMPDDFVMQLHRF